MSIIHTHHPIDKSAVLKARPIEQELINLSNSIERLDKALSAHGAVLSPALASDTPKQPEPCSPPQATPVVSDVTQRLREYVRQLECHCDRLENLTERVEL